MQKDLIMDIKVYYKSSYQLYVFFKYFFLSAYDGLI